MYWEIDRHDWSNSGESAGLPGWIAEMVRSEDKNRVQDLLNLISFAVVPPNGPLRAGAAAVTSCLVQGLLSATEVSREYVLYLLFQLAGGVIEVEESDLIRDVRREVELGLPIYAQIAESGTRDERLQCIDLLSMCARFNAKCLVRAVFLMRRIAALGGQEAVSVSTELADLESDGFKV